MHQSHHSSDVAVQLGLHVQRGQPGGRHVEVGADRVPCTLLQCQTYVVSTNVDDAPGAAAPAQLLLPAEPGVKVHPADPVTVAVHQQVAFPGAPACAVQSGKSLLHSMFKS